MYKTPKKPNEPRPLLLMCIRNMINHRIKKGEMTLDQAISHLLSYYTNVDLKLILDELTRIKDT